MSTTNRPDDLLLAMVLPALAAYGLGKDHPVDLTVAEWERAEMLVAQMERRERGMRRAVKRVECVKEAA